MRRPAAAFGRGACVAVLLAIGMLSACGGGDDSVSGDGTRVSTGTVPSYTIGGSIAGLTAPGLALTDNGGDALDVAANASTFTFSAPLSSGSNYSVSVQSQPAGETCALSNATGTANSDVTTILVRCGSSSYTIGGTISGLTVPGLVLLDNGGDALDVTAGGTSFTFSTSIVGGAPYAVTVQTQPSGETCALSNGSGTATANVTNIGVSCTSIASSSPNNVVALSVDAGPAQSGDQTFNIPLVTVTVCEPNSSTCATIPNVLLDTGSSGLRLMASVLSAAGVTLPEMADTSGNSGTSGNTIVECLPFADGYAWGSVATATVSVGGETTSTAIPVQLIDDNNSAPTVPSACSSQGSSLDSVNDFDANGVLGVGVFNQDCGSGCIGTANAGNNVYWTCTSAGNCSSTSLGLTNQVANPVAAFPIDNNGVIVQLQSISAGGTATASGSLVFGIGTESNNALGGATVLSAGADGNFTTQFNGQSLPSSFIDSGSNALYFNDSRLSRCGRSGNAAKFYCPSPTQTFSATNEGANAATSNVSFQVADLNDIGQNIFAIDDVAGAAPSITGFGAYFDWGLPFFYGRAVFVAIEGMTAGTMGPYYAY